jgi:hypothetical protein
LTFNQKKTSKVLTDEMNFLMPFFSFLIPNKPNLSENIKEKVTLSMLNFYCPKQNQTTKRRLLLCRIIPHLAKTFIQQNVPFAIFPQN